MALSYNLAYQESISVHPTRRQIFAGKPYLNGDWTISDLGVHPKGQNPKYVTISCVMEIYTIKRDVYCSDEFQ